MKPMILLSPAKSLREDYVKTHKNSQIRLADDTDVLVRQLQGMEESELQDLMSISENLARLNRRRYADYSFPFDPKHTMTAIRSFQGDVYRGLEADDWNGYDLNYAQKHLRILSGLYGLLRPLDLMHAYRLEMGTKLKTERGKNLYEFWGDRVTELLLDDLTENKSKYIINLASKEYFKVLNTDLIDVPIYEIHFREWRKGKWSFVSFNAKVARGLMARYLILNRVKSITGLKKFALDHYSYNPELSSKKELFFTREEW